MSLLSGLILILCLLERSTCQEEAIAPHYQVMHKLELNHRPTPLQLQILLEDPQKEEIDHIYLFSFFCNYNPIFAATKIQLEAFKIIQ